MKKLMVALAAITIGVGANAATISWGTNEAGEILDPSGKAYWEGDGRIKMYYWSIDAATYGTLSEGGESAVSANVYNTYKGLSGYTDKAVEDGSGALLLWDPKDDYGAGASAYAAVLFTFEDEAGTITHYKGNIGTYKFADPSENQPMVNMDVVIGGNAGSTPLEWSSVPEPTSGLLLLLGVAGLALKRKRA